MVNFWDTGMEIISLIKEIWEEPTPLKLETLRVKINEEIKKELTQHLVDYEEIIARIKYTKEKLRFEAKEKLRFEAKYGSSEDFIKTFLYRNFPHKLIKYDNMYLELLKYPEEWISSEVNQ